MMIRIMIADDHRITREGLVALIDKQEGMEVVAEVDNGRQAVKIALDFNPDIVIMDINMPGLNGIDATRQILSKSPNIKVIALSMYSERRYVTGMLKAGVSGYLLKNCAFEELSKAITLVLKNETYMSRKIMKTVLKDYVNTLTEEDNSSLSLLTNREREVLQMIAEGLSSNKIASRLFVSVKTVSTHRQNIMDKLKVYSVAELTKFAIRNGLTSINL